MKEHLSFIELSVNISCVVASKNPSVAVQVDLIKQVLLNTTEKCIQHLDRLRLPEK